MINRQNVVLRRLNKVAYMHVMHPTAILNTRDVLALLLDNQFVVLQLEISTYSKENYDYNLHDISQFFYRLP